MNSYVEIPNFENEWMFRTFMNDGMSIAYPHFHKEIEIIYSYKGSVNIGIDDTVMTLEEGEIIIFSSGQPHSFLSSPDSERFVYQFDLQIFDETTIQEPLSLRELFETRELHSRLWPEELQKRARSILYDVYASSLKTEQGKNYLILGNLYQLIAACYQWMPEKTGKCPIEQTRIRYKDTLEYVNTALEYVKSHYNETITLEEVAKHTGFSPYYFTRFFKKNTGKTFMQFLNEYRISQAKFILINERVPVSEVSDRSGFSNIKTFHHVFKKTVGCSPMQYQKQFDSY
ncbi:helix-turn-helix domain-containing protein [Enterococcus gilvus]|uniref:helix-turn-helix transcriptional regulator n=1 Tax=Enterococcus gilvus TaxID=160453 RepID=UPI00345E4240